MWLRPLQGTTQQGPLVHQCPSALRTMSLPTPAKEPSCLAFQLSKENLRAEPSNSPQRTFVLAARVTMKSPKRIRGSSKGEPSNAGLSSNSRGVLRPFDASAQASPLHPGLPHRVRSALRVSHPLDGLLLARTSGLVSCRKRPWGFALQGFSLTARSCQLVATG
jgi:hypothetical protein